MIHEAEFIKQDVVDGKIICCEQLLKKLNERAGVRLMVEIPAVTWGAGNCSFCGADTGTIKAVLVISCPKIPAFVGNYVPVRRVDIDEKPVQEGV